VKQQYQWVHKGKFARGIATQQHRERRLLQMGEAAPKNNSVSSLSHKDNCPSEDDEPPPPIQPQEHHYISPGILHKIWLSTWLSENQDDPAHKVGMHYQSNNQFWYASQNFLPRLKDHLLGQLLRHDHNSDEHLFTPQERSGLTLLHNRIYCINTAGFTLTTPRMTCIVLKIH
jgi:hypothetical protein